MKRHSQLDVEPTAHEYQPQWFLRSSRDLHAQLTLDALARVEHDRAFSALDFVRTPLTRKAAGVGPVEDCVMLELAVAMSRGFMNTSSSSA